MLDSLLACPGSFSLVSFALYGSIARGTAGETSDLDILVISDEFKGSLGRRIEELMSIEAKVRDEVLWLRKHGIRAGLSFHPLRRDEARRLPPLFLDLTEGSIILYDRDRFLEGVLGELKTRLLQCRARRIWIGKDRWYWDLKPDYKPGEVIEI